jgi:ubiquinone/menaquinone biosynthesis C-methylase UbiE
MDFSMLNLIRNIYQSHPIFNFNLVERDSWVSSVSKLVPKNSLILDVGAGSCPYRKYFSHCEYKTQDFGGLEDNQLRDHSGYGKIDYYCDATEIPVPDSSFDVVLCTEVLEHVPEPIKVVNEFARILKPGGKILLTAPLGSGIHQQPYHFYGGYTPFWYQKFLEAAGFENINIEPNGGFFKHYGQESIRFVQLTNPSKLKAHILFRLIYLPIWLTSIPIFGVFLPYLCYFLDRFDKEKDFTIGYHVTAAKKSS